MTNKNIRIARELVRLAKDLMEVNLTVDNDGRSDYSLNGGNGEEDDIRRKYVSDMKARVRRVDSRVRSVIAVAAKIDGLDGAEISSALDNAYFNPELGRQALGGIEFKANDLWPDGGKKRGIVFYVGFNADTEGGWYAAQCTSEGEEMFPSDCASLDDAVGELAYDIVKWYKEDLGNQDAAE